MASSIGNALGGIVSKNATRELENLSKLRKQIVPDPPKLNPLGGAAIGRSVAASVPRSTTGKSIIPEVPILNVGASLSRNVANIAMPRSTYSLGTGTGIVTPTYKQANPLAGAVAMPEAKAIGQGLNTYAAGMKFAGSLKPKQETKKQPVSPEVVKAFEDIATQNVGKAMENAATVMSTEWQDDHRFVLVKETSNGNLRLLDREKFDRSDDRFETLSYVSMDGAKSIASALGMGDDRLVGTPSKGQVDSTQAEASREQQEYDLALSNRRRREAAERVEVTEIDGKLYPSGTTEPVKINAPSGRGPSVSTPLADAPSGYVWVADEDGNAWLVVDQRDKTGRQIVPDNTFPVAPGVSDSPLELMTEHVLDPAAETFDAVLGTVIGGAVNLSGKVVKDEWKDWWDENVQGPFEIAFDLYNSSPEVRKAFDQAVPGTPSKVLTIPEVQNLVSVTLENPLAGFLTLVGMPQQAVLNVTIGEKIRGYKDENSDTSKFTLVVSHIPFVDQAFMWMDDNPEKAIDLYENGYDSNGDGVVDATGSMAVWMYWEDNEAGSFVRVMANTLSDPLTAAAGAGTVGKIVSRGGRLIRLAPEAGPVLRTLGRGMGVTGKVISGTARVVEDVSDLGLRYVLQGFVAVGNKLNGPVSSARRAEHIDGEVKPVRVETKNRKPGRTSSIGTLVQADEMGSTVRMEVSNENAPTTGPLARKKRTPSASTEDMGKVFDDAFGITEGDTFSSALGDVVKTEDGLEIYKPDGSVETANSTSGISHIAESTPGEAGNVPDRWLQREITPDSPVRYTDGMRQEVWNQVMPSLADDLNESALRQQAYNLPNDRETTTHQHLKESVRISRVVMDRTAQVDPAYVRPWEPLLNGNRADYILSEVFGRADWDTASKYWSAMVGGATEVPLKPGLMFRANPNHPLFSLKKVAKNIADPNHRSVRVANDTVDSVYQRLLQHPESLSEPAFARIVAQAAELDYDLRARGLRDIDPVFDWPPITTLIPDDAPVRLRPEVRSMGRYGGAESRLSAQGEYVGTVPVSEGGAITADIYMVKEADVPAEWSARYPDIDQWTWMRADVGELSAYGPQIENAVQNVREMLDAQNAVADAPRAPGELVDDPPVPEPSPAASVAPEPNTPQIRSAAETMSAERQRGAARTEKENRVNAGRVVVSDGVSIPRMPEVVGTAPDPTGTIQVPVVKLPDVPDVPRMEATAPGKKILDDVRSEPIDSPRQKKILADLEKKPLPPTKQLMARVNNKFTSDSPHVSRTGMAVSSDGTRYWWGRTIEDFEIDILTKHPFEGGETLMDRITRYAVEAGDKNGWKNWPDDYLVEAWDRVWPEYEALMMEVYPSGVLPDWAKAGIKKLPQPVQKVLEATATVLRHVLDKWDTYSRYRRERTLFGWPKVLHYPSIQYGGNAMMSFVAGDLASAAKMFDPRTSVRAWKAIESMDSAAWLEATGVPTPTQKIYQKYGITGAPESRDVYRGRGIGGDSDKLVGQATLERLPGGKVGSKLMGSQWAKKAGAVADIVNRETVEGAIFLRGMRDLYPDYRNMQINHLVDWLKIDKAEAAALWKEFDSNYGAQFSYNDVVGHFQPILGNGDAKLGRGRAERMGRDWQQTLNKNRKEMRKELRYRTMAQPETKLDLLAKRGLAFHFFQFRQAWFLYNQAVRHPFLINLYMNAQESLEEISKDWPPYMQGWVRVMALPSGRHLFLNPLALLSTYGLFEQQNTMNYGDSDDGPDSRPAFRKWFEDWIGFDPYDDDFMGVSLSGVVSQPISDLLNLTGQSGDIWAPDLLGVNREMSILTWAINMGRGYGLIGDDPTPIGNIYNDLNNRFREKVSSLMPGTETVVARPSVQSMDREIYAIMVDEAEKAGLDLSDPDDRAIFIEAQMNPDSDLYQISLKRWLLGEGEEILSRVLVGPLRPRTRIENREGGDLMADLTKQEKQIVNTPEPMVNLFRLQSRGFYDLGTSGDNILMDVWEDIAYGEIGDDYIEVNGVRYTREEIYAMDAEQRKAIANGFLAEYGVLSNVHSLMDERAKFLAQPENAEFAQQRQWSKAVREYAGGPEEYWKDLIKDNPTAEAYFNQYIRDEDDPVVRQTMMTNQNAYFAILGWDSYAWDKPIEGYGSRTDVWDPLGILNTAAQPTPYEEHNAEFKNEIRQAPVFLNDMIIWDREAHRKMSEFGYDPNQSFKNLPSKARTAIEEDLATEGIYEPDLSGPQREFFDWYLAHPEVANLSVDEVVNLFFEQNQQDYYEKLPSQTHDKVTKPKPIPGPDRYGNTATYGVDTSMGDFWNQLAALLNQHDHKRYKDPWTTP